MTPIPSREVGPPEVSQSVIYLPKGSSNVQGSDELKISSAEMSNYT